MLKSNLCYPYPILRSESIDYKKDVFKTTIDIEVSKDSYIIKTNYIITNDNINKLLQVGMAKKGLLVKSSSVWFRKFYDLSQTNIIELDSKEVYGKVELLPCIIATKEINHFYSEDFEEEYKINSITINPGEYIAIGEECVFDALLDTDIFKNTSSIFELAPTNNKEISYDVNSDKIIIFIPKEIHEKYMGVALNQTSPKAILNSTLVFPVLVSVLYDIKKDKDIYEDKKWYKTIIKTIEQKKQNKAINGLDVSGDIEDPLIVAQSLTNGLIINSFIKLEEILTEGDE